MPKPLNPRSRAGQAVTPHVTVDIDWERLLACRRTILKHTTLPPYLLKPEVHALLRLATHANHQLLYSTLWRTGARISEALALTPGHFHLNGIDDSYVSKHTSKRGRPKKGKKPDPPRLIPLNDEAYLMELETYITTFKIKKAQRLFPITRDAAAKRLQTLLKKAKRNGVIITIPVSLHTFRHSFAINCLLHRVDSFVLKSWLGHKHISSTEIYLQLFEGETSRLMRGVNF